MVRSDIVGETYNRRDGDAHLGPASAGEQYHAEGLYKDRSAFIDHHSSKAERVRMKGRVPECTPLMPVRFRLVVQILRGRPGRGDGRQMCAAQFDSASSMVRLLTAPVQYHISRVGTVGWVMRSPEVSPSSRDAVIACVVSSQKRGVDMTRGNYDSANNMLAYSNGNCPVLKTERG